jgi:hypothetical protein
MCFSFSWLDHDETRNSLMALSDEMQQELLDLTIEVERTVWIIIMRSILNKLRVSRRYNAK